MNTRVERAFGGLVSNVRVSRTHVVIVLVGLLAGALNLMLLSGGEATQSVAVLTRDVAVGDVITDADLRFEAVNVPASVEGTLVTDASLVTGQVAARPLVAGELLAVSVLRSPSAPSGLRAFSIPVPPERAVAGVLSVGDMVDVVAANDDGAAYLATGLEVLSVAGGEGGIGISAFSVTVAADAETVLRLAAALETETVSLVRSTGAAAPTVLELTTEEEPDA